MLAGGTYDGSVGYFVRPTLLLGTDPGDEIFCNEYFGPILSIHVYPDDEFTSMLREVDRAAPYALTGSIIARDRGAVEQAEHGAAVSRPATSTSTTSRPARSSGSSRSAAHGPPARTTRRVLRRTCMRWTSPRSIKETFVAPTSVGYPHQTRPDQSAT